jgi:hypothetical protein
MRELAQLNGVGVASSPAVAGDEREHRSLLQVGENRLVPSDCGGGRGYREPPFVMVEAPPTRPATLRSVDPSTVRPEPSDAASASMPVWRAECRSHAVVRVRAFDVRDLRLFDALMTT